MSVRSVFPFRSLFLKIFISFWLTMALTIGVLTLMARFSNVESLPERASRGPLREGLTLYSEAMVRTYEREGPQALDELVRRAQKESGTEVFLFDKDGKQVTSPSSDISGSVANVVQDLREHPQGQPQRGFSLFTGVTRSSWGKGPAAVFYRLAHCRQHPDCRAGLLFAGPLPDFALKEAAIDGAGFCRRQSRCPRDS